MLLLGSFSCTNFQDSIIYISQLVQCSNLRVNYFLFLCQGVVHVFAPQQTSSLSLQPISTFEEIIDTDSLARVFYRQDACKERTKTLKKRKKKKKNRKGIATSPEKAQSRQATVTDLATFRPKNAMGVYWRTQENNVPASRCINTERPILRCIIRRLCMHNMADKRQHTIQIFDKNSKRG